MTYIVKAERPLNPNIWPFSLPCKLSRRILASAIFLSVPPRVTS